MKVGDLITWRNPRERGKSEFKGYGLVIMAEMMGRKATRRCLERRWWSY